MFEMRGAADLHIDSAVINPRLYIFPFVTVRIRTLTITAKAFSH